jgi:hypothetical protein
LVVTCCNSHRTTVFVRRRLLGMNKYLTLGSLMLLISFWLLFTVGFRDQCLRFCSRVSPHEVLPQIYFKRWIWLPLMVSLTAQAQKGGKPATPPFTLYPFYWKYDIVMLSLLIDCLLRTNLSQPWKVQTISMEVYQVSLSLAQYSNSCCCGEQFI